MSRTFMSSFVHPRTALRSARAKAVESRAFAPGPALLTALFAAVLVLLLAGGATSAVGDCADNPVACENEQPGSPPSEWDVTGAGDPAIQGFATDISVNRGNRIDFKVKTAATAYRLDVYRLGWYGGDGARKVATVTPSASLPQEQPTCLSDSETGLVDCGNWALSASWDVPADAVSGVYVAKLVREDVASDGSHIAFVVRDDEGGSDLLFQTADTTWQAYNAYGGKSLYVGGPKASKVSYNRPFTTRGNAPEDWVFNAEYPLIRWLERNGYDVSYTTDVDTDRRGAELLEHRAFLSVGHDEYWSAAQRTAVEEARAAGVHLAFLSGNEIYWKTRWEPSIDASATPYRTLVSYKEGDLGENQCGTKCDPLPNVWTGLWRDGCDYPAADGCRPENALSGQISWVDSTGAIQVPAADGKLRLWRNTSVAGLASGQTATLAGGTLGYEWDAELDAYREHYPAGRIWLSTTNLTNQTHHLSLYRHASGSLVFGAGTVQWSWGLDGTHDRGGSTPDARMQQATVNLLADMGSQPATLQAGLVPATQSTDTTAPTTTVTFPEAGAELAVGQTITITGTASDAAGAVGAVEVSTDGGQTWRRAQGRESWSLAWTPSGSGAATIKTRSADDSGNLETPGAGTDVEVGGTRTCPCSLWSDTVVPVTVTENDPGAVELGVKFTSEVDGYITGLRFYKGPQNTGTHVGHLWTSGGTLLAEATFSGESASGWQEISLGNPVAVTANTTYVASYHAPTGFYSVDPAYFSVNGFDSPPLHAPATGAAGGNGVYRYGPSGSFPSESYNGSNYWVDVVFEEAVGPDTAPPTVQSTTPAAGATGVGTSADVTATFSEAIDAASLAGNFELRDAAGTLVPATVSYSAATRKATLDPNAALGTSATYTATVKGGANGVADTAGNRLAADRTWSFTTAAPPPPPPNEGPGGPVLVVGSTTNPFGRYHAEILRAEGLNAFTVTDLSLVTPALLAAYDVVILGEATLSAPQVTVLTDWVNAGGNLIAMRPDAQLAGLLGLTPATGTLANAYLKVATATAPGKGIVGETIQFHGTADRYAASGATVVATLYENATSASTNPAVTLRSVGSNGGEAAAFTYDLARSIVLTRQGNPAWSGQERDGISGVRSDDLFYPDWVDLTKVAIPQADEQQRLLVNLIEAMNADRKPLPRFWYFPRGEKAVVVMTGDDHGSGDPAGRFNLLSGKDPAGCSVAEWECVRGTAYVYPSGPLSDSQAAAFEAQGHEVALHVNTGCTAMWNEAQLRSSYDSETARFDSTYPSVPAPTTNRTHCISWNDYATQPKVELDHGIRLDTNYYYYPPEWIQDRPGMFTGSGLAMRFADIDGSLIDVYQAATQMTDESGQTYPKTIDALLDKAIGPEGYYGVFTANIHTDRSGAPATAIVDSAQQRSVPVVSARQFLTWLNGRDGSSFGSIAWSADTLSFDIAVGAGANGLQALLPTRAAAKTLAGLKRNGTSVSFQRQTIKGVEYAVFAASPGTYAAEYTEAPANQAPTAAADAYDVVAGETLTVDAPGVLANDSDPDGGDTLSAAKAVEPQHGTLALNANGSFTYTPTAGYTGTDTFTYTAGDGTTQSAPATVTITVTAASSPGFGDTSAADFAAGTLEASLYVGEAGDGELLLAPTVGAEFGATALPAGWTSGSWNAGSSVSVASGALRVDGGWAGTAGSFAVGRSLEFVATFAATANQHVGFGVDFNNSGAWAMFSTKNTTTTLYARTNLNGPETALTVSLGQPHRFRIEWGANTVVYFVDGVEVARHTATITVQMRPLASDLTSGAPVLAVDWMRLSPYAGSGTFLSRVFDAGSTVGWASASWQAQTPAGTAVALSVRTGDSASPDATWSAWKTVSGSGGPVGLAGRYAQYRAELSTGDVGRSPVLEQVALTTGELPANQAPVAAADGYEVVANGTLAVAAPGVLANDTDPDGDALTAAKVGDPQHGTLALNADGSFSYTPTAGYTGTDTFTYRAGDGTAQSDATTVTIEVTAPPAAPALRDTTAADFLAGTADADLYVGQGGDGELLLAPTVGAEFAGTALPAGWSTTAWNAGGGATVADGVLSVDGARSNTDSLYGPGRSVEFVATFGTDPFQHVGLGLDYNDAPWAHFSTGGGSLTLGLWAKTNAGPGAVQNTQIAGISPTVPHRYRIEWSATEVVYFIDGVEVARHAIALTAQMRPAASDFNTGGTKVSVDWLRMSPYAGSGTFLSRVFDAGARVGWQSLVWQAQVPQGGTVTLAARTGDSPTPDATWSAWKTVDSSGGTLGLAGRYAQYRAQLTSSDATRTPVLEQVTLTTGELPAGPRRTAGDFDGDGTTDIAVYRPSEGFWYVRGGATVGWGIAGDVPVPGDYDGDGTTDIAVYRPSEGFWYVRGGATVGWGLADDIPVPGDYDGDGTTDIAVYRPSEGRWYVRGGATVGWGLADDIPVPGDYDGDGTTDIAVYRPSEGTWYVHGRAAVVWGVAGDVPIPGDYDGDGSTDIAVYRPSEGFWYVRGGATAGWGLADDIPVPGDYDGDGTTDIAVYRPSEGLWYVRGGVTVGWGLATDVPLVLPYAIRTVLGS